MADALKQTALHDWHAANGGRLVDFAGWKMPIQYTTITAEHLAARKAAALFDVSHMGRFRFEGPGAGAFLDTLLTRRVTDMKAGQIRYSLVCNEQGNILDDVLVYRVDDPAGLDYFALVVNASNRSKIAAWIQQHHDPAYDYTMADQTEATAMIAVQGPLALDIAQSVVVADLLAMPYYHGQITEIGERQGLASRTGYTGEDGCELVVPSEYAVELWEHLLREGESEGVLPAGLGARDTLRLEAAMPLYGHELSEEINPYQAGLKFAVNLKDRKFVGRDALAQIRTAGNQPQRVGIELVGRRAPREGYVVYLGDEEVGYVTSGVFSPTLEKAIGMAYVAEFASQLGTELSVDIRGQRALARVVAMPFYQRPAN
ncbi:glycine cleavage system aminomethyltransferase GcvT [Lignipirellula cremea]|uniref:Aminomethyltransferase n=1 Tax=Lignipirellula cremea TaxID=2528010 RepID=A0A518DY07_9BACT|nr:glycine cleavage system aminomethyltransferase GcvT [Lignipirellula cremea]QDU96714.1 Glycine cleavage system T protein [Lignipirellula cremea]